MVKERMDLLELLRKGGMDGDVDFLREALRVLVEGIMGGYVNRCVNDIRRRPSQPLSQRRSHPRIERRDRRLRSTQGPSDA